MAIRGIPWRRRLGARPSAFLVGLLVALVYIAVSGLWIVYSDAWLLEAVQSEDEFSRYSTVKGMGFVGVMGLLVGSLAAMLSLKAARYRDVEKQYLYDAVTAVHSRDYIRAELEQRFQALSNGNPYLATLMVDVAQLTRINASLGRSVGDEILARTSAIVGRHLRSFDKLGRLEGDKFLVVMPPDRDQSFARGLARAIVWDFQQPMRIGEYDVPVRVHVGLAIGSRRTRDSSTLLDLADRALAEAKRGENPGIATPETPVAVGGALLQLESELLEAPRRGELAIQLQPQFDARSARLVGAEALVRWNHPTRGLVAPGEFIPLAEAAGFVGEITATVLDQVCRLLADWDAKGLPAIPVSFNLSGMEIGEGRTVELIRAACQRAGTPMDRLSIEITESAALAEGSATVSMLRRLRAMGVGIAIDDFGTGYSSLHYLHQLPADQLKIARQFITGMHDSRPAIALLRAINEMAHALGMQTIAEGAETAQDVELVRKLGIDIVQGYVWGRPCWPETFLERYLDETGHWRIASDRYAPTDSSGVLTFPGQSIWD